MASGTEPILISLSLKKENVTHFCQSSERGEEKEILCFFPTSYFIVLSPHCYFSWKFSAAHILEYDTTK